MDFESSSVPPHFVLGADGWCSGATRYDSPHYNARPPGTAVELLVVHNISLPAGKFGGPHVSDLFTGRVDYNADPSFHDLRGVQVSAHFLVRRDGRAIQYVSCDDRAWHAGVSRFQGRDNCNDFSIGVEMEGTDHQAFEPGQYATLAALTQALQLRYPLRFVQGHEHIAPGRKTDPGPCFDWAKLQALLAPKAVPNGVLVLANPQLGFLV
ncbi:MAG: 1,6-anhydro-N-acetylmuramyl-L-alanine amidase AmpD [Pseudomonadota bacterium]